VAEKTGKHKNKTKEREREREREGPTTQIQERLS
jgi:hypothetical protein